MLFGSLDDGGGGGAPSFRCLTGGGVEGGIPRSPQDTTTTKTGLLLYLAKDEILALPGPVEEERVGWNSAQKVDMG